MTRPRSGTRRASENPRIDPCILAYRPFAPAPPARAAAAAAERIMPRRLRLLFSHSTEEKSFERDIVMGLREALCQSFEILLDRTELKIGTDWRSVINSWIKICDAAVILITPESIASDFCRYEWDVLSFRRGEDQLPIVPIYYRSEPNDIKGKAHRLYEIAAHFNFDSLPNVVEQVRQALARLVPRERPQKQFVLLAQLLQDAIGRVATIEGAAEKIRLELGDWDLSADKWLRFAIKLMGAGIGRAWPALKDLQDYFDDKPERLDDIIDLIGFCSWVDLNSAHRIRGRAAPGAATDPLGLNARKPNTAEAYVLSATDRGRRNIWPIAFSHGVFSRYEDLRQEIETRLFDAAKVNPGRGIDALKRRIDMLRQGQEPIFVVLSADGLDAAWIAELRKDELLGTVNFLVLSGEKLEAGNLLPRPAMLQPDLLDGFERKLGDDYDDAKEYLGLQ